MDDSAPAPKPRRKWIPIVLGVLFLVFVLGIGGVIFSVAWFREHFAVANASESEAASTFDEIHAKFPGQQPLLEFRDGTPRFVNPTGSAGSGKPITTIHILAFDKDEGEMARFQIPF